MKDLAGLSVDVDSVASHLQGYGFSDGERDGKAYELSLPRALEIFGQSGARCTFFLIAEEALKHSQMVRSVVEAGHEIGCHSMTHPVPFDLGDGERRRVELRDARLALEDLCGEPVTGFRAPGWDAGPGLVPALLEAGYSYDASAFPSWMLLLQQMTIAGRSSGGEGRRRPLLQAVFGRAAPHLVRTNGRMLAEIPVCTVPLVRVPYYHTMSFLLPRPVFRALAAAARQRRSAVSYVFHAVDFLGLGEDGLDERIGRHPGMALGLAEKLRHAGEALKAVRGSTRRIVPLREIAGPLLTAGSGAGSGR